MYKRKSSPLHLPKAASSPDSPTSIVTALPYGYGGKISSDEAAAVNHLTDKTYPRRRRKRQASEKKGLLTPSFLFLAVVAVSAVSITCMGVYGMLQPVAGAAPGRPTAATSATADASETLASSTLYDCPVTTNGKQDQDATNFDPVRFQNHYLKEDSHVLDFEDFVKGYRQLPYDDWGQTYEHMKRGMTPWKQRTIIPEVLNAIKDASVVNSDGRSFAENTQATKSTFKIYESAIGLGLNALMTVELIQQAISAAVDGTYADSLDAINLQKNAQQLQLEVYGNEYLVSSTQRANALLDRVWSSPSFSSSIPVRKANVCTGDSTHLTYVPSNTFDLVYTGYVLPIGNPLHFDQPGKDPFGINHGRYHELCDTDDDTDWRSITLRDMAQRIQEDFYAAWVGEMIRIAKPGSAIAVEHVSQPKCEDRDDWGGVSKSWWTVAVERYDWPVDVNSIFFQDDHIYAFHRYHVFMRKLTPQRRE